MTKKKGLISYTEKYEHVILSVKSRKARANSYCGQCGEDVIWLSIFEASAIIGESPEDITRMFAEETIHFSIDENQQFLICAESLCE